MDAKVYELIYYMLREDGQLIIFTTRRSNITVIEGV
jgi:hypothetical protein